MKDNELLLDSLTLSSCVSSIAYHHGMAGSGITATILLAVGVAVNGQPPPGKGD